MKARIASLLIGLLALGVTTAQACDTRRLAQGAASFNSCETPWSWSSGDASEDLYSCPDAICGGDTTLRITLRDKASQDVSLPVDKLLESWTKSDVSTKQDRWTIEMTEPVSIQDVGGRKAISIVTALTSDDGTKMNSFSLRFPTGNFYVTLTATTMGNQKTVRDALMRAGAKLAMQDNFQK